MEAFHFGAENHRLFGILHHANDAARRETAFVICQPIGVEYDYSHRTLSHLAERLATSGFDVLRFDYFGSGDAGGCSEECTVPGMLGDVALAVEEIRQRRATVRLGLLGLRFGASLAWLHAARHGGVDALILWALPAVGRRYIHELRRRHRFWVKMRGISEPAGDRDDRGDVEEWMGFPLTGTMRKEISALNPADEPVKDTQRMLIASRIGEPSEYIESLSDATHWDMRIDQCVLDDRSFWYSSEIFVPHEAVERLATGVESLCP